MSRHSTPRAPLKRFALRCERHIDTRGARQGRGYAAQSQPHIAGMIVYQNDAVLRWRAQARSSRQKFGTAALRP